ncbi:hypothetical protein M8542_38380 [Amycolatopsis sp. OK19-0408]|uniref:Uncharacterized protein n=1 Tax=Amycolatopsis iheyensis TaxID=2945988 RepID=A0A9X2NIW4_9PSEU|nr:hypothetical protein [Amycolatopsis iheyensis]MCR6488713.1 hypothetical protein [Amycolatopsis iheyensis]
MTSGDDPPRSFQPLPGRTVDRSAAYEALLQSLLDLIGVEPPPAARTAWHHQARREIGKAVTRHAKEAAPAPEEWFEPLLRAAIHEPNPSLNRQLVDPLVAAYGRDRVRLALIAILDTGSAPDAAGAARAWYWTHRAPTGAGQKALSELYRHTALRRFVTDDDLDLRRCILPGLPLDPEIYPAAMHDLVTQAVRIARTSPDDYLRHRVEIQVAPCS